MHVISTLKKIYEEWKSKLCDRRNKRPAINKFATFQRTDIMVRKRPWPDIPLNSLIDLDFDKGKSKQHHQQLKSQLASSQIKKSHINRAKPSTYNIGFQDAHTDIELTSDQSLDFSIISNLIKMDRNVRQLQQVCKKINYLQTEDSKRKKYFWKNIYQSYELQPLDRQLSELISQNEQEPKCQTLDKNTLQLTYTSDITSVRELKYSFQLPDYPEISLETYCHIRNLWLFARKYPADVVKLMKLKILQKLTYRSFRTLSFGSWLNDEIINGYLELIQSKAFQVGKQYKILNSFFAQTTFSKSQQMMERALKRKKILKNNIVVIAINNGNHWFFAKIKNSKIMVYDSIKKDASYYTETQFTRDIFGNIKKFADWFYQKDHFLEVDQYYPQQQNSFDCGMFLLNGIKDVVRDKTEWTFSQQDINFKRIQIARQLLDQEVTGFEI